MNPLLIIGIVAGVLGLGIGYGVEHKFSAADLANEKAAHAADLAKINAASAQALSAALSKQQAAESDVSAIEKKFNEEVQNHAKDSLNYRAQLANGTERVRVKLASCTAANASESTGPASVADGTASYGILDGKVAGGIFKVAEDDQVEIDKLAALQAYVRAMQDQGFIGK